MGRKRAGKGFIHHPAPPNSTKLSLWETGQVKISGMSVEARCGMTQGHHTHAHANKSSPGKAAQMTMEEDLVLGGCDSKMGLLHGKQQPTH